MDKLVFLVAGAVVILGALFVVISRNPIHAALSLVGTLFGVAVLFVEQEAHFLAAVQVIVYAGAIVVLFLFVIMLLGVDRDEDITREPLIGQRPLAFVLGGVGLIEVLVLNGAHWASGAHSTTGSLSGETSNVEKLARAIFTRYLLPFEATSVLLVIAVIGAVVLARRSDPLSAGEVRAPEPEESAA